MRIFNLSPICILAAFIAPSSTAVKVISIDSIGNIKIDEDHPQGINKYYHIPQQLPTTRLIDQIQSAALISNNNDLEFKERKYRQLYEDLVANEDELVQFLVRIINFEYAVGCMKGLDALAHIHYDRREWKETKDIIDLQVKIIDLLGEHPLHDIDQRKAYNNMLYELYSIEFELAMHTEGKIGYRKATIFRSLVEYEKMVGNDAVPAEYTSRYLDVFRPVMAKYDFFLSENVDEITDENLIDAFELIRDETIFAEKFDIKEFLALAGLQEKDVYIELMKKTFAQIYAEIDVKDDYLKLFTENPLFKETILDIFLVDDLKRKSNTTTYGNVLVNA